VNRDYDRISIHGVQRILLEQQADSLGFPLEKIYISKNASMEEYESEMQEAIAKYLTVGVSSVVFGDVFLWDVRRYREDQLSRVGMKGVFPLWKKDTHELAQKFIDLGFKAIITCVDSKVLDKKFVGGCLTSNFCPSFLLALTPAVRMENSIHLYMTDRYSNRRYPTRLGKSF
jgi:diphthamide synthase (EF-2-diphthine--ammonia ligase)